VPENHFGEEVAGRYDNELGRWGDADVVQAAIDFLANLADGGAVLELGIGTGRIALPLAARGIPVHGIDLSEAMVARLRAKPGGAEIPVVIGDFSTTRVEGAFSLVYLVFNTIMNLTAQDAQVACFANASEHLRPGGCFVVEVGLPQLQRLPAGQTIHPFSYESPTRFGFDEYDVANQGLVSHHYDVRDGSFGPWSIPFRYVWPSELDLMARLAGMRTRERWSGWRREPFTSESETLVGVWEKPG
jgi:SAM-dependent methyltransferase